MKNRFIDFLSIFCLLLFVTGLFACKSRPHSSNLLQKGNLFEWDNENRLKIYDDMDKEGWPMTDNYKFVKKQKDFFNQLRYSVEHDTIYLLEYSDVEGRYWSTLWNKEDTVVYKYESNSHKLFSDNLVLQKNENIIFAKYKMKLISEWDINQIRKEEENEKLISPYDNPGDYIATRIIFDQKKYRINRVSFINFYEE